MQFLESSIFGLRTAHYRLYHRESDVTIEVLPMVHIGEPQYYDHVRNILTNCNLVIVEGIKAKGFTSKYYRRFAGWPQINLVTQDHLRLKELDVAFCHGDMTEQEFATEFKRLPLLERIWFRSTFHIAALFPGFMTRAQLSEILSLDDLSARDEAMNSTKLMNLIVAKRDKKLISVVNRRLNKTKPGRKIGIIWGAAHMPALTSHLIRMRRFVVTESNWMTVFQH